MMAPSTTILKAQALLVVFLLMNSVLVVYGGRPLSIIETGNSATGESGEEVVDLFDWLSHSLGPIKHSVPKTLGVGEIKDSGPSGPGVGHKFTNPHTLGGIKDSGPSSGGEGHKFTNTETLGGIKDSGPSPGQGH